MQNFPLLKMSIERQYNSEHRIASYIETAISDCHEILPRLYQLVKDDSHSSQNQKEICWLVHSLAVRVLFQYTVDNWDHVYYSGYDFPNKNTHPSPDEVSENQAQRINDKCLMRKPPRRQPRIVHKVKIFDKSNLPLLIYPDVEKELDQPPHGSRLGKRPYAKRQKALKHSRVEGPLDKLQQFWLLFNEAPSNEDEQSPNGWQFPFAIVLNDIRKCLSSLSSDASKQMFEKELESLYMTYFHCTLIHQLGRFSRSVTINNKKSDFVAWAGFDEKGKQVNLLRYRATEEEDTVEKFKEQTNWIMDGSLGPVTDRWRSSLRNGQSRGDREYYGKKGHRKTNNYRWSLRTNPSVFEGYIR